MAFNTRINSIVGAIIVLLLIAGVALVMQRAPETQRDVMSPEMDQSGITEDDDRVDGTSNQLPLESTDRASSSSATLEALVNRVAIIRVAVASFQDEL